MFSVYRHRKKSNSRGRIQNNLVRVYIDKIYEPGDQDKTCNSYTMSRRWIPALFIYSSILYYFLYLMHIVILDSLFTTYSNLSTKITIYSLFSISILYMIVLLSLSSTYISILLDIIN